MGNIIEVWEYNERENCGGRSQEEEVKKGRVGRSNIYRRWKKKSGSEDQDIEEETKKCVVSPQERQRVQAQL